MTLTFKGELPTARSNHGAILTSQRKIVIFGGENSDGYLNDVYILDPNELKSEKPHLTGTAPFPRAGASATRVYS